MVVVVLVVLVVVVVVGVAVAVVRSISTIWMPSLSGWSEVGLTIE